MSYCFVFFLSNDLGHRAVTFQDSLKYYTKEVELNSEKTATVKLINDLSFSVLQCIVSSYIVNQFIHISKNVSELIKDFFFIKL